MHTGEVFVQLGNVVSVTPIWSSMEPTLAFPASVQLLSSLRLIQGERSFFALCGIIAPPCGKQHHLIKPMIHHI